MGCSTSVVSPEESNSNEQKIPAKDSDANLQRKTNGHVKESIANPAANQRASGNKRQSVDRNANKIDPMAQTPGRYLNLPYNTFFIFYLS